MKKFQFTLQALLTLRERQEQLALQHYSQLLAAWEKAQKKANAAERDLEAAWSEMQEKTLTGCPAFELDQLQRYCRTVQERKQLCDEAALAARNKAGEAFTKLVAARQARTVV